VARPWGPERLSLSNANIHEADCVAKIMSKRDSKVLLGFSFAPNTIFRYQRSTLLELSLAVCFARTRYLLPRYQKISGMISLKRISSILLEVLISVCSH
jgi:hypothetical protein